MSAQLALFYLFLGRSEVVRLTAGAKSPRSAGQPLQDCSVRHGMCFTDVDVQILLDLILEEIFF